MDHMEDLRQERHRLWPPRMWLEELEYCGTQEYCEKSKYRLGVESGVEFWSCCGMPTGQPTGDNKSRIQERTGVEKKMWESSV